MMRSLWSGVSGMQAHQIAIDVEGNNIANVNTAGFKYSRANFSDILSQTPRVATAPQGELGGQNAMQIGLGTSINSTTRIFSQGTLTSTDKNTDLALQGNGFFVVSPDGGTTRYYTRNGDFLRDKAGNFVNESGHIVQGWTRDEETGTIDTTAPIKNIVIKEGLTTPARATKEMKVKGNLDSGNAIGNRSTPIYSLDSVTGGRDFDGDDLRSNSEIHSENDVNANEFYTNAKNEQVLTERGVDLGVTFNELGNGLALRDGQGIWVSYANAVTKNPFQIGSSNPANIGQFTTPQTLNITLNNTTITATVNNISEVAAAINAQYNNTGVRAEISEGYKLTLINRNNSGTTANTKNIHLVVNGTDTTGMAAGTHGGTLNIITAYQYKYNSSSVTANHQANDGIPRSVHTTEDLRAAIQKDMRAYVDYNGDGMLGGAAIGTPPSLTAGEAILAASDVAKLAEKTYNVKYNTDVNNGIPAATAVTNAIAEVQSKLSGNYLAAYNAGPAIARHENGLAAITSSADKITATNAYNNAFKASIALGNNVPTAVAAGIAAVTASGISTASLTAYNAATATAEQGHAAGIKGILSILDTSDLNDGAKLTVNKQGQYQLENPASSRADQPIYMTVTGLTQEASSGGNAISENTKLTTIMSALEGAMSSGQAVRTSGALMMSSHGATAEIYDSLGSKHTVSIKWAKTGTTSDGGTEWSMIIQVPEPAEINFSGSGPRNVLTGSLRFNSNGSLASFNPAGFSFTANNGSAAGQSVRLNFGLGTDFNGLTSFDKKSSTDSIAQDGYAGGTLTNLKVDENGTIIGTFSNGKSFGLAQVAVATFTNQEGLHAEGENVFSMTSNSGEAVIGTAGSGDKGTIAAAKLEASNVDLSRALTQLIVIQRGYQANSKTITTSDEMLNTLLQLKN